MNHGIFCCLLLLLCQHAIVVKTFDFSIHAPAISHLQSLPSIGISRDILETVDDTVWSLLLPVDQQDAVAIFISEGVSGFLGGAAGKVVSLIDGNKNNRQSSISSAEASGAYFGTAAAIRSLASLAGFSSIFVNLVALITAALASEIVKIRNTSIVPQRTRVGEGPTMYDLMKFKNPSMIDLMKFAKNEDAELPPRMRMMGEITRIEIAADLVKYFCIYSIFPRNKLVKLEDAVIIGSVAGIISQLVREQKDRELDDDIRANNARKKNYKAILKAASAQEVSTTVFPWMRSLMTMLKKKEKARNEDLIDVDSVNPMTIVRPDYGLARFARSSLETATQLLTYEAARQYVMEVSPYFKQGIPPLEDLNSLLLS